MFSIYAGTQYTTRHWNQSRKKKLLSKQECRGERPRTWRRWDEIRPQPTVYSKLISKGCKSENKKQAKLTYWCWEYEVKQLLWNAHGQWYLESKPPIFLKLDTCVQNSSLVRRDGRPLRPWVGTVEVQAVWLSTHGKAEELWPKEKWLTLAYSNYRMLYKIN